MLTYLNLKRTIFIYTKKKYSLIYSRNEQQAFFPFQTFLVSLSLGLPPVLGQDWAP